MSEKQKYQVRISSEDEKDAEEQKCKCGHTRWIVRIDKGERIIVVYITCPKCGKRLMKFGAGTWQIE